MEEKEVDKILNPQKKLIILLVIFLSIGIIFIGVVFYIKFVKIEEPQNFKDIVSSNEEKEGKYAQINIAYLPQLLATNLNGDNCLYFVMDEDNNIYIMRLSTKTFSKIIEKTDIKTGKLDSIYNLKGTIKNIDEQVKNLALKSNVNILENEKLTSDNFSEYLGKFYIEENEGLTSDRMVTLYTISILFGLFFLILAFGYIVPAILKARKALENKELLDELRIELSNLTDFPYKKHHIYLTRNYIISGMQAFKYEDILWIYVLGDYKYGKKLGNNLIVHTKDKKIHTIVSVGANSKILDDVMNDISIKNSNIKIGYNEENMEFFENYKK